jgi:Flp pilus assembly protein TadD
MRSGRRLTIVLMIAAATLAALSPLRDAGFLDQWDDPDTIARNPNLNPPSVRGVVRYWTAPHMDLYVPLTYTAWGAVAAATRTADGQSALAFHAANVALHVFAAIQVFAILALLLRATGIEGPGAEWAAGAGALLFALHPLQVEAVAWASGLKDVLSGGLALAAIHCHLRTRPVLAWLLFLLAMLAKPSAVAAIAVAGVLDVVLLRTPWRRAVAGLAPWLAAAVPLVVVARLVQVKIDTFASPYWARPLVALDAVAFYLAKLAWPGSHGIDYGRSPDWLLASGRIWLTPWAAVAVAAVVWWLGRRAPWVLAAAAIFVGGLLPTLGLSKFSFQYYSTVGDHYVYLAMLGPALAFGFLLARLPAIPRALAAALVLLPLGALSHAQTRHWRSSVPLFEHALRVNPDSVAANVNLGLAQQKAGKLADALLRFRAALRVRPENPQAHNNIGNTLITLGRFQDAIPEFRAAIATEPDTALFHYNLGIALAKTGAIDDAVHAYRDALRVQPDFPEAHTNLATLLSRQGDLDGAIQHYEAALRLRPDLKPARSGLASALARKQGTPP